MVLYEVNLLPGSTKYFKKGETVGAGFFNYSKVIDIKDDSLILKQLNWLEIIIFQCKAFFSRLWMRILIKFYDVIDSLSGGDSEPK
jgi:hypothetical protein